VGYAEWDDEFFDMRLDSLGLSWALATMWGAYKIHAGVACVELERGRGIAKPERCIAHDIHEHTYQLTSRV
jgi:hypothetical protein